MTGDEYVNPWPPLMQEIGSLVVAAGQLESALHTMLMTLMGGPHFHRNRLVIEGYSTGQVRERCERLAPVMLTGDLRSDVLAWLARARAAQSARNGIVHSSWADKTMLEGGRTIGPAATTTRLSKGSPNGIEYSVRDHSPEDIRRVAEACTKAHIDGYILVEELQLWLRQELRDGTDLTPWTRPAPKGPARPHGVPR